MNNQLELSFQELLEKAQENYNNIFPKTTFFERAIFFSWGCTIGDCTFCYMSTQPSDKKPTADLIRRLQRRACISHHRQKFQAPASR